MKRLLLLLSICITSIIGACSNDYNYSYANLPNAAKQFLQQYFSDNKILFIEREFEDGRIIETVHLQDASEIEFTSKGEWIEVSCPNGIPEGIVPKTIHYFIEKTYPKCFIIKVKRKPRSYEIELNNDKDLIFNTKGEFVRYD